MSELAQWLFQKERETIVRLLDQRAARLGTVIAIASGTVTVADPMTGAAQSQPLAIVGAVPAIGEKVVILPLRGGERVAMRLAPDEAIDPTDWYSTLDTRYTTLHNLGGNVGTNFILSLRSRYPLPATSNQTIAANRLHYVPVWVPDTLTVDAMVFEITTYVAGGQVIAGIYANSTSTMQPAGRIASTAKTNIGLAGVKTLPLTSSVQLTGGRWYWFAFAGNLAYGVKGYAGTQLPSLKTGLNADLSVANLMGFNTLSAGWTEMLASGGSAGVLGNFYLELGARQV